MTSQITTTSVTAPDTGIIAPFASQTLFWRARYLCDSPFLHHLSSLFWIIEALRPAVAVEIGVHDGASYFATCQSMDKLVQSPRCHGLGVWPNGTAPADIQSYNDQQYAEFSTLEPYTLDGSAQRFESGSIDLLHVDLEALELNDALVNSLSKDWSRKMSRRGVVVLHGIYKSLEHSATSAFIKSLGTHYPTISLEAESGALVVLFGADRNPRLQTLATLNHGEAGYSEIHQMLRRLGALHHYEWANRDNSNQVEELRQKLAEAEALLETQSTAQAGPDESALVQERDAALAALQETTAQLQTVRQTSEAEINRLTGLLASQTEQASPAAESPEALAETGRLKQALAEREQAIVTLTATLEQQAAEAAQHLQDREAVVTVLKTEVQTLEKARTEREQGIATLTATLEQQATEAAQHLQDREAVVTVLKTEVQTLEKARTEREQGIATLTATLEQQATEAAQHLQDREAELTALQTRAQTLEEALEKALEERKRGITTLTTALERQTDEAAQNLRDSEADLTALKAEIQTLEKALEERAQEFSHAAEQRNRSLQILTDALEEQTTQTLQNQQEQDAVQSALRDELARMTQALADSEHNFDQLRESLESRGGALAVVTAQSQQWQQALQSKKAEATALRKETEALRADRDTLKQKVRALETERTELLNSTSWKLTATARKILGKSRSDKR